MSDPGRFDLIEGEQVWDDDGEYIAMESVQDEIDKYWLMIRMLSEKDLDYYYLEGKTIEEIDAYIQSKLEGNPHDDSYVVP